MTSRRRTPRLQMQRRAKLMASSSSKVTFSTLNALYDQLLDDNRFELLIESKNESGTYPRDEPLRTKASFWTSPQYRKAKSYSKLDASSSSSAPTDVGLSNPQQHVLYELYLTGARAPCAVAFLLCLRRVCVRHKYRERFWYAR